MTAKAIPTELDRCVEIYVPTECRCGKLLPEEIRDQALEEVKSSMGTWFGGGSVKSVPVPVRSILTYLDLPSRPPLLRGIRKTATALKMIQARPVIELEGLASRITRSDRIALNNTRTRTPRNTRRKKGATCSRSRSYSLPQCDRVRATRRPSAGGSPRC